jgi:hypothetical protein
MIDSTSKQKVMVEKAEHGFLVKLHDYGDKDFLEDRLAEDFDISPIWLREEQGEHEIFILQFPDEKDGERLQAIIDGLE